MQKKMRADIEAFLPEIREVLKASENLGTSEIVRIGTFVAEKVYALQRLTDSEKKAAVVELVAAALAAEQVAPAVSTAALEVLPAVIDLAVSASRGVIRLPAVSATVTAGLARFWSCFSRKGAGAVKASKKAVSAPAPVLVKVSEKKTKKCLSSSAPPLRAEPSAPSTQGCSNCDCAAPSQAKDTQPETVSQKEPSPVASLSVVLEDGEIQSDSSAKELPNMPSA
jgi:hypothetical protein